MYKGLGCCLCSTAPTAFVILRLHWDKAGAGDSAILVPVSGGNPSHIRLLSQTRTHAVKGAQFVIILRGLTTLEAQQGNDGREGAAAEAQLYNASVPCRLPHYTYSFWPPLSPAKDLGKLA
jgi:hypothetical protein